MQQHRRNFWVEVGIAPCARRRGFTLIEILIVVILLALLAGIVIPQIGEASENALELALEENLQIMHRQITFYIAQHRGRSPHLDEDGNAATGDFVNRLTMRTDPDGALNPSGELGPYLQVWPPNPYNRADVAKDVLFGTFDSPMNDLSGWYFNTSTRAISSNTRPR